MIDAWIDPPAPSDDEECSEHPGHRAASCPECAADLEAARKRWSAHIEERHALIESGQLCDECLGDRRDPNDPARPCRWCLGGRVVPGTTRAA